MKKHFCIILLLALSFQFSAAGSTANSDQPLPATVYFFRLPDYVGSAIKMTIKANDQPVVRLRNNCYFKYELQPGSYLFSLAYGSSSSVSISVESGKEYYIRCYITMGFWGNNPILELVDPVSGKATIEGNRLFNQPYVPISLKPNNSRIGLYLGGGIGFEKIPWFTDSDGNDITLSTGGGFSIGGEYGHRFSKHFDLSVNMSFQSSSLEPYVKNATGTFNRMAISVTPAFVIPIKGGETVRLKIGAGPGLCSFGTMNVDASKVNGSKYLLKYVPAPEFHGLFLLESNFSERGSINFGIRCSLLRYNFDSRGTTLTVTDPLVKTPNGSSFDFFIGYNFLF